jgi:vacuolar-type H+-ATPase subunit I/STV1
MHEPPAGQFAAYPRDKVSPTNLKKVAIGMQLLLSIAIFCGAVATIFPMLFLLRQGDRPTDISISVGYIIGLISASGFIPTILSALPIFFGLKAISEGLEWQKKTPYLVTLGIVLTFFLCGGIFFYGGILVAVNRGLANLGAPNWSALSPRKLRQFAETFS